MKEIKGFVKYYLIEDWYVSLSNDYKEKVKHYYALPGRDPRDVTENSFYADVPVSDVLWPIGLNAVAENDYDFANKILEKSLELSKDVSSKHFSLMGIVDLLYKQRNNNPAAISRCIDYCLLDIEIAEEFINAWKEEEIALKIITGEISGKQKNLWFEGIEKGENDVQILKRLGFDIENRAKNTEFNLPSYPSFTRLAIIYEKQERYLEAIDICELAERLGLSESNTKKYSDRIQHLTKKARRGK